MNYTNSKLKVKNKKKIAVNNIQILKQKMLNWINKFNIFCLLDSQGYQSNYSKLNCIAAVGEKYSVKITSKQDFEVLEQFYITHKNEWIFGHISYDLKNKIEKLTSTNKDGIGFEDLFFFVPQIIIHIFDDYIEIETSDENNADFYFKEINEYSSSKIKYPKNNIQIESKISKNEYVKRVEKLKEHISKGDCYEINFCQEFYANAHMHPLHVYQKLMHKSPNPFSAWYKINDKHCICASPERYIQKSKNILISQPIKGTAKRDLKNSYIDEKNKTELLNSKKEISENIMVVDLVRNDFNKICKNVQVKELNGLYSFPQVHQLISTICGEIQSEFSIIKAIKATFPMGSMTGVPKKKVMELIDKYEETKRGLFSGAIGYINPNGDFDFNVVIRSVFYNETKKYISFQTGGAITFKSNAKQEYRECLLKAKAIKQALA